LSRIGRGMVDLHDINFCQRMVQEVPSAEEVRAGCAATSTMVCLGVSEACATLWSRLAAHQLVLEPHGLNRDGRDWDRRMSIGRSAWPSATQFGDTPPSSIGHIFCPIRATATTSVALVRQQTPDPSRSTQSP